MQLTPLYDSPSFLRLDISFGDPGTLMVQQRQRLADLLAGLDDEGWAVATRCDGWTVKDVATHLVSTNQFWTFSIGAARQGDPTRFLTSFDPVSSPAQLVAAARSQSAAEVLDQYVVTSEALAAAVDGLEGAAWAALAEAPPGHIPLAGVVLHALWDAWIHERDVVLPLGLDLVEDAEEVAACLEYAAALGPALAVACGSTRAGTIAVEATDPATRFVVEVADTVRVHDGAALDGALRLTGDAVALTEGLSLRAPFPCVVPDEQRWLVGGLATTFDQAT